MIAKIREEISKKKRYEARINMLKKVPNPDHEQIERLRKRSIMIDSWLMLLNSDEMFVVKLRAIDGLDWGRIGTEYRKLWGEENQRTYRTLRRYFDEGMNKILEFILQNPNDFPLSIDKRNVEEGQPAYQQSIGTARKK